MQVNTAIPLFPSPSSSNGTSGSHLERIRSQSTQHSVTSQDPHPLDHSHHIHYHHYYRCHS
eukprot:scaffold4087_cov172-Chaetoceros_neogracile.AAC.6